jgi:hypothetical protein
MVVCAHGDVSEFCEKHEMEILESYSGSLEEYKGNCAVIVTAEDLSREDYDSLKCSLFSRKIELVSVKWPDDEVILRLLRNQIELRGKRGGRQMYGFYKKHGLITEIPEKVKIARRIIELRDAGKTLREIQAEAGGYYENGRPLSMSTISEIIKNRKNYER